MYPLWFSALMACLIPAKYADESTAHDSVTYYAHIQPIMRTHCTRCHSDAGVGPGDFTNVENVEDLADYIWDAVDGERMPPPSADPECADYVGSDQFRMKDEDKATIKAWINGGKIRGEHRLVNQDEVVTTNLQEPDITIPISPPYAPDFSEGETTGTDYHCFVLDTADIEGKYITGLGSRFGIPAIVHHITLSMVDKAELEGEQFSENDWDCIGHDGKLFNLRNMFAGFAPGSLPWQLPEGAGFLLDSDTAVVAAIHYAAHPDYIDPVDETKFDFHIQSEVESVVHMTTPNNETFSIPAGATGYAPTFSVVPEMREWSTVYNILPHMHLLGRGFDVRVKHSNGEETCVAKGDFDFDNQVGYQLVEPIQLSDEDTLQLSCSWDNPGESAVKWGINTEDEMCIFFTIVGD